MNTAAQLHTTTAAQLHTTAAACRQAQRAYFATRTPAALDAMRSADRALIDLLRGPPLDGEDLGAVQLASACWIMLRLQAHWRALRQESKHTPDGPSRDTILERLRVAQRSAEAAELVVDRELAAWDQLRLFA